jgi:3-phenylpropionate/trans-cinnamate dioxygenase ferredoxin subunit
MDQTENWIKIADHLNNISFPENNIAKIQVRNKSICLIKTSDGLKACSATCPHAGGDLSEGFVDKIDNIICPIHNYRFSLNSGRDRDGEGYFLKIYRVKETEQGIFIKLE